MVLIEYNNSSLSVLFYSRVVSGKVGYAFDHKIFDVDDVQLKDQILYFDDINMNDNKIKGLDKPIDENDASNKQLLDEVEHDIMNYQNQGLCYLPKPKAEADNTDTRF